MYKNSEYSEAECCSKGDKRKSGLEEQFFFFKEQFIQLFTITFISF